MEELFKCPVCESNSLSIALSAKDYFFTQETFQITKCNSCGFLFTNPRPNSTELNRYYQTDEYLSHATTKKTVLSILYSFLRNVSIKRKYSLISKIKFKGKILDIGCGTGEVLNYFNKKGWETLGIEPAENPRNFAVTNYGLSVFDESHLDNLQTASFDIITMWHVLEHVSDLNERITQVKRILKNDGTLIVAVPNSKSWDARHYKKFWAAWDLPRHLYHFSTISMTNFMNKRSLSIEKIYPMKFDSYYVSILSEKYQSGKTNCIKSVLNGFRSNLSAKNHSGDYSSLIFQVKKQNI
jgi:2-polyprenyl-3-methyl-5-hydroxy-6-metoxy-1,4-benzoquinol methylase